MAKVHYLLRFLNDDAEEVFDIKKYDKLTEAQSEAVELSLNGVYFLEQFTFRRGQTYKDCTVIDVVHVKSNGDEVVVKSYITAWAP